MTPRPPRPKRVMKPEDMTAGPLEQYAILTWDKVYIPGDERSRTNPGHGYPERTESHAAFSLYETRELWLAAIKDIEGEKPLARELYIPLIVRRPVISTKLQVDISE